MQQSQFRLAPTTYRIYAKRDGIKNIRHIDVKRITGQKLASLRELAESSRTSLASLRMAKGGGSVRRASKALQFALILDDVAQF